MEQIGLGKEYFCRYFKKNTGMLYGRYLNEVRLSKIHHDLFYTDEPVFVLMEKHGFMNSKLLYEMFWDIYGCRHFFITRKQMSSYDDSGKSGHKSAWVIEKGTYIFYVGNSSQNVEKAGDFYRTCRLLRLNGYCKMNIVILLCTKKMS